MQPKKIIIQNQAIKKQWYSPSNNKISQSYKTV